MDTPTDWQATSNALSLHIIFLIWACSFMHHDAAASTCARWLPAQHGVLLLT